MKALITEQDADGLNDKVQTQIDQRLFLCCNYTPTASYAFSEDALYLTAIQDLYKFSIDTSCVIKNYYRFIPPEESRSLGGLRKNIDHIQMLRAVQCHNQNERNGQIEQQRLQAYQQWLARVLHKPVPPSSPADFAVLLQDLAHMAEELCTQLEQFIAIAAASANKEQLVQSWIDQTLDWYSRNTKRDLYYGQLESEYIRRSMLSIGRKLDARPHIVRQKVERWIGQAIFAPIDRELKQEKAALAAINSALDRFSTAVIFSSEAQRTSLQSALQKEQDTHIRVKEKLEEQREELEKKVKTYDNHVSYFFSTLKSQLLETMADLDQNNQPYTLLPQDLLAIHIDLFFCDVPSPDGDF